MTRNKKKTGAVLVVDVGNTSTSFGLYTGSRVIKRGRLKKKDAKRDVVRDALTACVGTRTVRGAVLACVASDRQLSTWQRSMRAVAGKDLLKVDYRLNLGIPVTYPKPETIGADRLANAVGAVERYGAPVIVADFGTALTFDVVSARGGYTGGVIAPGIPLMFDYLAEKTARLPHVEPGVINHPVGKSTCEAIRMGTRWGYQGMVREILANLRKGLRGRNITLCATGGFAKWVLKDMNESFVFDPDLTLYGLGVIFDRNEEAT